jgi:hypothetical protein
MPPLFRAEAGQIFRQRGPFGLRQRPQLAVLRSRHVARSLPLGCLRSVATVSDATAAWKSSVL